MWLSGCVRESTGVEVGLFLVGHSPQVILFANENQQCESGDDAND